MLVDQQIPTKASDVVSRSIEVVDDAVCKLDAQVEVVVLPVVDLEPNTSIALIISGSSEPSSLAANLLRSEDPTYLSMEIKPRKAADPSKIISTEDVVVENTKPPMVEELQLVSAGMQVDYQSPPLLKPTRTQGV